jgi:FAD/FMN-containing dehydrogenase
MNLLVQKKYDHGLEFILGFLILAQLWNCDIVIIQRVRKEVPDLTLLGAHSSHSYLNGTNLYFVYYYHALDCRPEEELTKYHLPIKKIIVEETIKAGGSICHHHGVGKNRTHWIQNEYGHDNSVEK